MKILTTLIVASLTILSGCATHNQMRFKAGSGDAGQFIVQQAVARGAQPISTADLPAIRSGWRFGEDQYGVVVRLPRADGAAVERMLQQAFGEPTYGPKDTPTGGRWGAYRLWPPGVSIQFTSDDQGTEVVVLRQLTKQEHGDGVARAMREIEKGEPR
jgi:hypothetical protein